MAPLDQSLARTEVSLQDDRRASYAHFVTPRRLEIFISAQAENNLAQSAQTPVNPRIVGLLEITGRRECGRILDKIILPVFRLPVQILSTDPACRTAGCRTRES
jgi:hypothetical protein